MNNNETVTGLQVFNFIKQYEHLSVTEVGKFRKIKMALGVNKANLQSVYQTLVAEYVPVEGAEEYIKERQELIQRFAKKDDKGNIEETPVKDSANVNLEINDKVALDFNKEMKELITKHQTIVDALDANETAFNNYLREPIAADVLPRIAMITYDDLPDNYSDMHCGLIAFMLTY